jgi:type I restriction enzyme M protein
MAKRLYFIAKPSYQGLIVEKTIHFENFRGQSLNQKHKSIESMHHAIRAYESGGKILEVSTISPNPLGRKLAGVTLSAETRDGQEVPVMNIFESAKVFEKGGPYRDLLEADPFTVSEDKRLTQSGRLLGFHFENTPYSLTPRHLFFDWIYMGALYKRKELHEELAVYDMVTDIEYNMQSMFASSARACAYFISLYHAGLLDEVMKDPDSFSRIYTMVF